MWCGLLDIPPVVVAIDRKWPNRRREDLAGPFRARLDRILDMKFTIRDVLWLMAVVGLACALMTSRKQAGARRQEIKGWRTRAGALEVVLKDAGWKVRWEDKWIRVRPRWKLRYYEVSILTC